MTPSRNALAMLAIAMIPPWRRFILKPRKATVVNIKLKLLFLSGQISGGVSELLLTFSISLADPALVNSLQGVQYILLFIFSLFWANRLPHIFKEVLSPLIIGIKITGIIVISAGLYILAFL